MPGQAQTTQNQSMSQTQNPYAPTIPALNTLTGQLSGLTGNTGVTTPETNAFAQLNANAAAGNPFSPAISNFATNLLSGGGANNQAGAVSQAGQNYQSMLAPYTNMNTDPTQNPMMANLLETIRNDATNSVNSQFAGAGRDLSGANSMALGRGIAQGEAPALLGQYNTNVGVQRGAQDAAYGAGNTTAGLLSGLNQQGLANQGAGVTAADSALTAQNYAPTQQLNIAQMMRNLPIQNISNLLQPLSGIAGLGGQTTGQSTTTGTQTANPWQTAISALLGGAAIGSKFYNPGSAAGGAAASAAPAAAGAGTDWSALLASML